MNQEKLEKEIRGLASLLELVNLEKQEEIHRHHKYIVKASIVDRIASGISWYPVIISARETGIGGYLVLDIERTSHLEQSHHFSEGKTISLFANRETSRKTSSLQGVIKRISGNKLKLALSVDELPDWIEDGKLGMDLTFDESSYREMEIALKKAMYAENDRLAELRGVLCGNHKARFLPEDPSLQVPSLNASQNEALRKAASARDIGIIHGPPGTGKTTTLVEVIKHTLTKEHQVMICSPSNVAVDLLTEKLVREGIRVLRLGNPARVSEEVILNTLDARITSHKYYKELKGYLREAGEFKNMAGKYKRKFGKREREQRELLYAEARSIMKEARKLEDYILDDLLDNAQVVACTPVGASARMLRNRSFDTLFFDEAAQALEPMSWIPLTKAGRVIFAGDHCQLPPTVKSREAQEKGLGISLFEKVMKHQNIAVMLNTQYRMNEKIMRFSSGQFYKGELLADASVKDHLLSAGKEQPLLDQPLEFIDTAGCGFEERVNPETLSSANPEEVALLFTHLNLLLEQFHSVKGQPNPSIGIISPYKEQLQDIKDYLAGNPGIIPAGQPLSIKTIDGFQGQEKDIIYISLVRSNQSGEIGFLSDIRRMNVALTRARKKLVVIGDSATLGHHAFYKDFLDYAERIGAHKSAWEFMDYKV